MNELEQRSEIMEMYNEATASGARQRAVCDVLGLSHRTIQRWNKADELQSDGRKSREFLPPNKLTEEERQEILNLCNSREFCEMSPNQIVPILAERKQYIASERTFISRIKGREAIGSSSQNKAE